MTMPFDTVPSAATVARVALTDTHQQTLVAAPGTGYRLKVYALTGSNAGGSLSTVDIKDGSTIRFSYAMASSGGGFALPPGAAWLLAENSALNVQQSAAVNSYVSAIYTVVGAAG
jgi:hypothetical protein